MPIYEYKCNNCNHIYEKLVKISNSSEPQQCIRCGDTMIKLVSNCSHDIKGYCYKNNYKNRR